MARGDALERTLERLRAVRDDPSGAESLAVLRAVLAGRSAHAAAKAAAIAGEFELAALVTDLATAFERFLVQPVKSDPAAPPRRRSRTRSTGSARPSSPSIRNGIRHVQMEPVWGGKADTATALRGTCALALVRVHDPDYLIEIADLLADREAPARKMAAQALAYSENPAAVPLLRLKALLGDEDPQVLGECLLALLAIAPRPSLDFVAALPRPRRARVRRGRRARARRRAPARGAADPDRLVGAHLRPGAAPHRAARHRHAQERRGDPAPAVARRREPGRSTPARPSAPWRSTATTRACAPRSRRRSSRAPTGRCERPSTIRSASSPELSGGRRFVAAAGRAVPGGRRSVGAAPATRHRHARRPAPAALWRAASAC